MALGRPPATREECEATDRADPLRDRRKHFVLPEGVIYLDGHSLGPATAKALERVRDAAMREWAQGLIRSWNEAGWIDLPLSAGAKLARLIGAKAEEVVVCDSVSVNLFKLAGAALPVARSQTVIVELNEFPTDQYVADGLSDIAHVNFMKVEPGGGLGAVERAGSVLIKSVVNYRTARVVDVAAHERAAAKGGGFIVWDLSHATGVLALDVGRTGMRLAAGCTYKFVNGGPGAPAFVYVRSDMAETLRSPISGWFGHADPFAFASDYEPRANAARFAAGTPGILSLSALDGALEAFDGADVAEFEKKARALGELCIARAEAMGLKTISPKESARRGGHVSLIHEQGYAIVQALIARGVIADFRAPDAMRFGLSPLFVRYIDVWDAMDFLGDVLATRDWDRPAFKRRAAVT